MGTLPLPLDNWSKEQFEEVLCLLVVVPQPWRNSSKIFKFKYSSVFLSYLLNNYM